MKLSRLSDQESDYFKLIVTHTMLRLKCNFNCFGTKKNYSKKKLRKHAFVAI